MGEPQPQPHYIVITGGNISGIGKGSIGSSCGLLLRSYGFTVSAIKVDPYVNMDAGTMSPSEHGECFVTADGYEGDLDMGNYERFLDVELSAAHNITTGQVYQTIIERERRGDFLGRTVQIIPHITDHIGERIERAARIPVRGPDNQFRAPEIVIVELGGTVGDIESEPFLYELSRRFKSRCFYLHVALLLRHNGELKTKLVQDSVKSLNHRGITPDALCLRCDVAPGEELTQALRDKLSQRCGVQDIVISGAVNNIYEIPALLQHQRLQELIARKFGLLWRGCLSPNFNNYLGILRHFERARNAELPVITVGIVAKYLDAPDTYLSLRRALEHASFRVGCDMRIVMIAAEDVIAAEDRAPFEAVDCIIIPGGFGTRGIEGKLAAITHARKHRIPLLGICLGMQLMVVEYCRNVCGVADADSTEFTPGCAHPVVGLLEEYGMEPLSTLGGSMRLGDQTMLLVPGTRSHVLYGRVEDATERHRHRYEVHPTFERDYTALSSTSARLIVSAVSASTTCVPEMVEYTTPDAEADVHCGKNVWWAVGIQGHPEYITSNNRPHPLFVGLLEAALQSRVVKI